MKAPGFRANPGAYDLLKIGGLQIPGEWQCEEFERELKFKHPKGSGDDGGPTYPSGIREDSEITITTKLHNDVDEAAWEAFVTANFAVDGQSKRGNKTVENVQAARMGIREVLVKKVSESRPLAGGPIVGKVVCRVTGTKTGKSKKAKKAGRERYILSPNFAVGLLPVNQQARDQVANQAIPGVNFSTFNDVSRVVLNTPERIDRLVAQGELFGFEEPADNIKKTGR